MINMPIAILALVYRRSPFSSLGKDSAAQQRQEIRDLAQIVAAEKEREKLSEKEAEESSHAAVNGQSVSSLGNGDPRTIEPGADDGPASSGHIERAAEVVNETLEPVISVIPVRDAMDLSQGSVQDGFAPIVDSSAIPASEIFPGSKGRVDSDSE